MRPSRSRFLAAAFGHPLSLTAWREPALTARLFVLAVAVAASRVIFISFEMIPQHLEFQPALVLVALAALAWGAPAVWGAMLGVLVGDLLVGQFGSLTIFRLVGIVLFAGVLARFAGEGKGSRLGWMLVAALGLAGCQALGSEWLERYPFGYVCRIASFHHLCFLALLASPLSWGLRRNAPRAVGGNDDTLRRILVAAGVLALSLGAMLASGQESAIPHLGNTGGRWVEVVAMAGLIPALGALLMPSFGSRRGSEAAQKRRPLPGLVIQ